MVKLSSMWKRFKKKNNNKSAEKEALIEPTEILEKVNKKKGLFKGSWTWREYLIVGVVTIVVVVIVGTVIYFTSDSLVVIQEVIDYSEVIWCY